MTTPTRTPRTHSPDEARTCRWTSWHLLVVAFMIDPFAYLPGRAERGRRETSPDRGDVPGWVLITMMTAGLVVALWALAGDAFTSMFEDSMSKVRGSGG